MGMKQTQGESQRGGGGGGEGGEGVIREKVFVFTSRIDGSPYMIVQMQPFSCSNLLCQILQFKERIYMKRCGYRRLYTSINDVCRTNNYCFLF